MLDTFMITFGVLSLLFLTIWTVVTTLQFFWDTYYNQPYYMSRADRAIKKAGNKYPSQPVKYREAQDLHFKERMRRRWR